MGAEGIRRGISRASDAELWHDDVGSRAREDVESQARGLVYGALDRYSGPQLTDGQAELFAEFVTLALAAGVTPLHVSNWIKDLCGDWG